MAKPTPKPPAALVGLIFTIFSLAALFFLKGLLDIYGGHWATRGWEKVPAQVLNWDLKQTTSGTGRNLTTSEKLIVSYRYQYQGKTYTSDRLDLSFGSDNFSRQRRYRQMEMLRQPQVVAFVNPDQPQQSLLDRSLPGAQVSFLVFFMVLPCGVGTLFMLSWLLKAWNHFSRREDDRFLMPLWGALHGSLAFYPLLLAPQDLSVINWLILLPFALLGGWCITEIILRLRDARRGTTPRHNFRKQLFTRLRG